MQETFFAVSLFFNFDSTEEIYLMKSDFFSSFPFRYLNPHPKEKKKVRKLAAFLSLSFYTICQIDVDL